MAGCCGAGDAAGAALHDSARQIDASHQLRTPLAGLLLSLSLERQPPDVPAALESVHHLQTTIADLSSLRRIAGPGACDPGTVAAEAVQRWSTAARPVTLRSDVTGPVGLTGPALRQSLDVLLDNALRHGAGPVTVTVEPCGDTVLVEVADRGVGFADGAGPGTGLQLVTSIVERAGGTLLVRSRAAHARVALLPPLARVPADQAGQSTSKR